jgi:hypothetical protein
VSTDGDIRAGAYVPRPGDRVTVRRYQQPTLADGDPQRSMTFQVTGTLTGAKSQADGVMLHFDLQDLTVQYDDDGHRYPEMFEQVFTGYVFLKPDYLVTEVVPAADTDGETFGRQLSPELVVATDSSQCIVLLVGGIGPEDPIRRVTVSDVDALKAALDDARTAQRAALAAADERGMQGVGEARRARGRLDRYEASKWLTARGMPRARAASVVRNLRTGDTEAESVAEGMTFDGTYWIVPPEQA